MTPKKAAHFEPYAFPTFEFGHVLPPKITSAKVANSELRSCLSAAIYMASQIQLCQDSISLRVEPIRSAYFRAALAELIRVEDITKASGNHFIFSKTRDPLLHAVKLLRNYQVHVGVFDLEPGAVEVLYGGQGIIYESFIADNLSTNELRKLNSAANYTDEQLDELLQLFDFHQRKYGVVQLLFNTCLHVGALVAKT